VRGQHDLLKKKFDNNFVASDAQNTMKIELCHGWLKRTIQGELIYAA